MLYELHDMPFLRAMKKKQKNISMILPVQGSVFVTMQNGFRIITTRSRKP